MRVVAGKARRLLLKTPRGENTRPTSDRIKETLFNMLQPYVAGSVFLDLFAGSGQIGIEALSRGAKKAVFVDSDKEALRCIRDNLMHTRLAPFSGIFDGDAFNALRRMSGKEQFDIVFMDPPYMTDYVENALSLILKYNLITSESLIIAEAPIDKDFSFALGLGYEIIEEKEYKTNKHVFLKTGG